MFNPSDFEKLDDICRSKHKGHENSVQALNDNKPRRGDQRMTVWNALAEKPRTCISTKSLLS